MSSVQRLVAGALVGTAVWLTALPGVAQTSSSAPPDNTKANREQNQGPTAEQQKENKADRELARRIRRAITDDKSLSTYGRNVKIIAQEGKVTLKGPVRSETEKKAIESKAAEVAGDANVTSEITIASRQKS